MPGKLHERIIDLFRQRPQLAADLLTVLDTPLPEFDHARLESGDFPDIDPTEYRADAVVVLATGTKPALAVIIEVQLKPDNRKTWSWPVYVTTLRARLHCPTVLLVICPNERTAARCRSPIDIAPGCRLAPIVLSPEHVPVITDPAVASANVELAVLSAIAHRNDPERDAILTGLAAAIVDVADYEMYIDLVMAVLPKAGQHFLEGLKMRIGASKYISDFARNYYTAGEAGGEAKALLTVLEARGLPVPEAIRTRIDECTDLEQFDKWLRRAAGADSLYEVFDDRNA
ncbi:hypothetical protein ACIA8C_00480 [Nocardia sp. NPDC051321]|uniref:hypothetical protein n=1 Tax=Nocardia sp. NPDC051321 TaxID=3364323 RepID=UPI0037B883CD